MKLKGRGLPPECAFEPSAETGRRLPLAKAVTRPQLLSVVLSDAPPTEPEV